MRIATGQGSDVCMSTGDMRLKAVHVVQGADASGEKGEGQAESAHAAFEEAGQLVVNACQAQEDAAAARQEADCLTM